MGRRQDDAKRCHELPQDSIEEQSSWRVAGQSGHISS